MSTHLSRIATWNKVSPQKYKDPFCRGVMWKNPGLPWKPWNLQKSILYIFMHMNVDTPQNLYRMRNLQFQPTTTCSLSKNQEPVIAYPCRHLGCPKKWFWQTPGGPDNGVDFFGGIRKPCVTPKNRSENNLKKNEAEEGTTTTVRETWRKTHKRCPLETGPRQEWQPLAAFVVGQPDRLQQRLGPYPSAFNDAPRWACLKSKNPLQENCYNLEYPLFSDTTIFACIDEIYDDVHLCSND